MLHPTLISFCPNSTFTSEDGDSFWHASYLKHWEGTIGRETVPSRRALVAGTEVGCV